jgi:hypothetical protein
VETAKGSYSKGEQQEGGETAWRHSKGKIQHGRGRDRLEEQRQGTATGRERDCMEG